MAWVAAELRFNITFTNISRILGKPANEFMESDPEWVPSLNLGHTEVKVTTLVRFICRIKRQRATRGENSAPAASQDVPGQVADMNKIALNVKVDGDEQKSEVKKIAKDENEPQECRLCSPRCAEINCLLENRRRKSCQERNG
ncbi:hypothetical protein AMECASPLE_020206 [Ameca splendens]|uniref:Uncharacterized protein n=1 Tax=Ameca splendens TaxID=208324 RepID=A0ABV0ZZ66_9TELE